MPEASENHNDYMQTKLAEITKGIEALAEIIKKAPTPCCCLTTTTMLIALKSEIEGHPMIGALMDAILELKLMATARRTPQINIIDPRPIIEKMEEASKADDDKKVPYRA